MHPLKFLMTTSFCSEEKCSVRNIMTSPGEFHYVGWGVGYIHHSISLLHKLHNVLQTSDYVYDDNQAESYFQDP